MLTNIHNIFLYAGQPECFRYFCWVLFWAGQTGRELPNILPNWGSQNTLGKIMHYIFGIVQAGSPDKSCMQQFPPAWCPPYRETRVAIPLSHCASCGIADYRCCILTSFLKNGLSRSKDRPNKGGLSQKKLASEAYRAVGGGASHKIVSPIAL